ADRRCTQRFGPFALAASALRRSCISGLRAGAGLWSVLGMGLFLVALAAPPVAAQTMCMNDAQCNDMNPCTVDQCVRLDGGPRVCVNTPGNMGTVCRAAAGVCDLAETCTGSSPTCPPDTFQPITVTCRASTGDCDPRETCTGTSATCPADVKSPGGTACTDDGNVCTTDQCGGTPSAGNGICEHPAGNAGAVCRASAGQCDVAENCTGTSGTCPADGFASASTSCTGTSQGGACDGADHCSGTSNSCVDVFSPASTVCRTSAGQCDVAENCTGTSGACPADGFASSATTCTGTSQGGACDNTDHCSGISNTCVDGFKPSTTECRASAGQCDVAENCTGTSGVCPTDVFAPLTTTCTGVSQGGACDNTDHCSGISNTCVDGFKPSTTECRASAGQCDVAE